MHSFNTKYIKSCNKTSTYVILFLILRVFEYLKTLLQLLEDGDGWKMNVINVQMPWCCYGVLLETLTTTENNEFNSRIFFIGSN
jgi:hypothetical protein